MRILLVDIECAGLDFAQRAVQDGHQVRLWQPSKHPIGEGFEGVRRVPDWRDSMAWVKDGLVVLTGNAKFTRELDRYRDLGFNIFGPTYESAQLEIDRAKGMKAMEDAGIEVPHYETFSSLEKAAAFARKTDKAYVFKTLGSEDDKSLSYVSSDPADMVAWIERQCARGMKLSGPCMLQEKIDMLAELGVSGWVGPNGFLERKWQICFEHKKLMCGEIGPNTGEMGTICQYAETDKLADAMLKPLELQLIKLGHRGDFAIGCGIDQQGRAWPFEFTARLGWPAFYIQCASHKGDIAQWMLDILKGEDTLKVDYHPAIGVVLAQPPWPEFNGKLDCVEGNPISGMDETWDQCHPVMMQIGKGPVMKDGKVANGYSYQTCGELVACVTALGSSVEAARKRCYDAVDRIKFSDMMFRTDIGEKLKKQLPKLRGFGYAREMAYD